MSVIVRPVQQVLVNDPGAVFGRQVSPHYTKWFSFGELGAVNVRDRGGWTTTGESTIAPGFRYDRTLQAIYNSPIAVPHDNLIDDTPIEIPVSPVVYTGIIFGSDNPVNGSLHYGDYTFVEHAPQTKNKTHFVHAKMLPMWDPTTADSLVNGHADIGNKQGFRAMFSRSEGKQPHSYVAIRFKLGPDQYEWYQVMFDTDTSEVRVSSAIDSGHNILDGTGDTLDWKDKGCIPISEVYRSTAGAMESTFWNGYRENTSPVDDDFVVVDVILINHQLSIMVNGLDHPVVIPSTPSVLNPVAGTTSKYTEDHRYITEVNFASYGHSDVWFNFTPWSFAAKCWLITNEENIGVNPSTDPGAVLSDIKLAPCTYADLEEVKSTRITVSTTGLINGSDVRFRLTCALGGNIALLPNWNGIPYVPECLPIMNVKIDIPGVHSQPYARTPVNLSRKISPYSGLAQDFVRSLSVSYDFDLSTMNISTSANIVLNNRHGEFANALGGLCAMQIHMGLMFHNGGGMDYVPPGLVLNFTGWGGINTTFTRTGNNESVVSFGAQDCSFPLRNSQSWCVPWLDGWCHYEAIRFIAELGGMHPDMMAGLPDSHDPYTCDHYHLPMGSGGSPLMRFEPGTTFWNIMNTIRQHTGYMLFFDNSGQLRYEPWNVGQYNIYPNFYERPVDWDVLKGISGLTLSRNIDFVNSLTLIGIDQYGPSDSPIVCHRSALDTVYGSKRFLGFKKIAVWADSQFATLDYASEAADGTWELINKPIETVQFTCIVAPYVFPLDKITLYETEAGAQGDWYVTRSSHQMNANMHGSLEGTSTISAIRFAN